MIVSSSVSTAGDIDPSSPSACPLADFARTGMVDRAALASVEPQALAHSVKQLSPQQQGRLAAALDAPGPGGLLDGVLGIATGVVDGAVTTPSERQAEDLQEASRQMRLSELRGQAELEMVLAPYEKLDRPSAALAWVVSVVSPDEGDPARTDPPRTD